jgi:hypothetical protein
MTTISNIPDYYAGDTLVMQFTVRDKQGRPIDLTGAGGRYGIAPKTNARTVGDAVITLTSGHGNIAFSSNVATVTLDAGTFTQSGDFVHELEIVLASGQSLTVARGDFKSLPAILSDRGA